MKKKITLLAFLLLSLGGMTAQTYVNNMSQAEVERDCYIEGGGTLFNDNSTEFYNDHDYIQKAKDTESSWYIFNQDICGNKSLTGLKVNMLIPGDRDDLQNFIKIEYSLNERDYFEIPDMKIDVSYEPTLGGGYWNDIYYQAPLPAGTKEIKVTLLAFPGVANWIPCYRRTELFYVGGTKYEYVTPPYVPVVYDSYKIDFESEDHIADMSGSQNSTSSIEVVDNPLKSGINTSNKVLKIVQDPADVEWGWGNADWFGIALALKGDDPDSKKKIKITPENGRYLNMMILRKENSLFGLETWGGTCVYKDQAISFNGSDEWQMVSIDLEEFFGKTFQDFYFSPNELFGTNNVLVAETTYIDNVNISATAAVKSIKVDECNFCAFGGKGVIKVSSQEGLSIQIYSTLGSLVNSSISTGDNVEIPINAGSYIVRIGHDAVKVMVY